MSELEPTEIGSRRAARERALELLYEAEAKDVAIDVLLAEQPIAPAPLAVELVQGVQKHRERIDELVSRFLRQWSLERLAAVDRSVLRVATFELVEVPERSTALIINEAVVLARRFGTDDSPRFVNGVLSSVAAAVRPGGDAPGEGGARPPAGPAEPPSAPG